MYLFLIWICWQLFTGQQIMCEIVFVLMQPFFLSSKVLVSKLHRNYWYHFILHYSDNLSTAAASLKDVNVQKLHDNATVS